MTTLNPLGSEKLKGDDKIRRIMEIANYGVSQTKKLINENSATYDAEFIKKTTVGIYGIVKEGRYYYVKKGLNESTLDYIGGMFMKNKNKFNSYAEALKRLELISNEDVLEEQKKYILKQPNKSASEMDAPIAKPSTDSDLADTSDEDTPENDIEEIQKYSGKLAQSLRSHKDKLESDDIKYVINMILSAIDLNALEDNDRDDIVSRFEKNKEETTDIEDFRDDSDIENEDELDEIIGKLENFVNNSFDNSEKSVSLSKEKTEDELSEIDLDELNGKLADTLAQYFKK